MRQDLDRAAEDVAKFLTHENKTSRDKYIGQSDVIFYPGMGVESSGLRI